MKKKLAGKRRKVSDAQARKLREWQAFPDLCREIGISQSQGYRIHKGYYHKQPSP